MDEEFGSFVVTDPDIVDPSIDVSGLRTQTDTSLLGNIPDFAGIQYEAFNPTRLTDLMRLYTTGLPMIDTPAAAVPPATGGGGEGSGDGGQATIPTDDFNQQEFEENLIDQGVGLQIAPDQPVVAPGEVPVTNLDLAIDNDPMLGVVDVDGEGEFGGLDEGADPDRIQANEFAGLGVNEDLIDRGNPTGDSRIVSEEQGLVGGITDRGRGQIPTSTDEFDVTTDQFTRPTMADVAGPGDFTGAPITIEDLTTSSNVGDFKITTAPDLPDQTGVLDAPPSISLAKDPVGVEDPFDGKYTMSTSITPQDTEQSITQKVADFLGIDTSKINKAAVTGALNLVAGKALDTIIPIATVFNLVKDAFVRSPEQEAAEEQARQDRIEEAAAITRRIEEEDRQRRETEAREAAAARAREEAAQRAREEAARAAAIARQQQQNQGGGGRDRDPAPSAPATRDTSPSSSYSQASYARRR